MPSYLAVTKSAGQVAVTQGSYHLMSEKPRQKKLRLPMLMEPSDEGRSCFACNDPEGNRLMVWVKAQGNLRRWKPPST